MSVSSSVLSHCLYVCVSLHFVCLPVFPFVSVSPFFYSDDAQQAGPLEHEAEGTTFHWPAAPLPTSLRPLPGTTLHPGQIPISINTDSTLAWDGTSKVPRFWSCT